MRSQLEEWWQWFPERQLLTDLCRRDARRRAGCKCKSGRDCRRPDYLEGSRIARALWADIQGISPPLLNVKWEAKALPKVLAAIYFPPYGRCSQVQLEESVDHSRSSRVHHVALERILKELDRRGEAIPPPLLKWWQEVASGQRWRPDKHPVPPHRPIIVDDLVRDLRVQFTVELLNRLGVRPRGNPSGCFLAGEALGLTEEAARHIWNRPIWGEPYGFLYRKHAKAIAERHGLLRTTPA